MGVREVEVRGKAWSGRESAITGLNAAGLLGDSGRGPHADSHNGCRPRKQRASSIDFPPRTEGTIEAAAESIDP